MAIGEVAIGEDPIGSDEVGVWPGLDFWVLVAGVLIPEVQIGSCNIEQTGDGRYRCNLDVLNPVGQIREGMTVEVIWRGENAFSGIIRTLSVDSDQAEAVFTFHIEGDGWDAILQRRTITKTYNNQLAGVILRDAITASGVNTDGVTAGLIDWGAVIILAESNHVRMSDFVRDIGVAGGGLAYINPYKQIVYRPTTIDSADVVVTNARALSVNKMSDLDNYRNHQIVKVTGLDGTTTVTETRNNLIEQAIRSTDEGGSGIYEEYQEIKHPTSSVAGELSILGQTVGFLQLRNNAKSSIRVAVRMRDPAPRIGQLTMLDLPGFGVAGTFIAMRKTWSDSGLQREFMFDIEFWESSFQQLALESLLRIVGAGKAAVSISANVFPNVQLFSTAGADTWTVPAGVTTAQFTAIGGSGGGAGGLDPWFRSGGSCFHLAFINGGHGGASGKAVTILAVVPGNVWDINVGSGGTQGTNGVSTTGGAACATPVTLVNGGNGTNSNVSLSSVIYNQGNAGGGALGSSNGAPGGGIGDAISVGGGVAGGSGGRLGVQPTAGGKGYVEVRW